MFFFILVLAENWGFYTMLTEMPTFLSEILNFEIAKVILIYRNIKNILF
jgi:hypothetical protein